MARGQTKVRSTGQAGLARGGRRESRDFVAERVMDPRWSVALRRRRGPVLLTSGLIGAVLGLLYGVLVPAQLTSTSLVLLQGAGQSASDGVIDIDTQVRLALSRPVLQRAGRAVHPAESATEVEREVSADGATAQLMEI